jgi:hypothetical protein
VKLRNRQHAFRARQMHDSRILRRVHDRRSVV